MQSEHKSEAFAFPGSTTHYLSLLPFDVQYMFLKLQPDFESKTLTNCEEILQIKANREITELELDIAEMKIDKVHSRDSISDYNNKNSSDIKELDFNINTDKLIVKLARKLEEEEIFNLIIKYSAGYRYVSNNFVITTPRSGFHFVEFD